MVIPDKLYLTNKGAIDDQINIVIGVLRVNTCKANFTWESCDAEISTSSILDCISCTTFFEIGTTPPNPRMDVDPSIIFKSLLNLEQCQDVSVYHL